MFSLDAYFFYITVYYFIFGYRVLLEKIYISLKVRIHNVTFYL